MLLHKTILISALLMIKDADKNTLTKLLLPGAHKAKEHATTCSNCCQIPNSGLTKYGYSV